MVTAKPEIVMAVLLNFRYRRFVTCNATRSPIQILFFTGISQHEYAYEMKMLGVLTLLSRTDVVDCISAANIFLEAELGVGRSEKIAKPL